MFREQETSTAISLSAWNQDRLVFRGESANVIETITKCGKAKTILSVPDESEERTQTLFVRPRELLRMANQDKWQCFACAARHLFFRPLQSPDQLSAGALIEIRLPRVAFGQQ